MANPFSEDLVIFIGMKEVLLKSKFVILLLVLLQTGGISIAQQEVPSVRVIYLVSADRQERSDYKEAIEMAVLHLSDSDGVLIAGKGHETHQIFGDVKTFFDDRIVARNAILKRKKNV